MGVVFHAIERLGPPFLLIDERRLALPREGGYRLHFKLAKLIVLLRGSCRLSLDDGPAFAFREGDALILPGGIRQTYVSDPRNEALHVLRLVFQGRIAAPRPGEDAEAHFPAFLRRHFHQSRHFPGALDVETTEWIHGIRREAEEQAPGFRFRIEGFCRSLIIALARRSASPGTDTDRRHAHAAGADLVHQAREYLLKNMHAPIRLEEVARHCGVSEEHLARVTRRLTGHTLFEHLRRLRLETAKTYLAGTDMSATEIARRCGFSSLSLFSRSFKIHTGLAPRIYRRDLQGQLDPVPSINRPSARAAAEIIH